MRRYLVELLRPFWASAWLYVTGLASVLSWYGIPNDGTLTLHKKGLAIACTVTVLFVLFLVSAIRLGLKSYLAGGIHPSVMKVIKSEESPPCVFIVNANGTKLRSNSLLSVYREVNGVEVTVAVLRIDGERLDGGNHQCVPLWYSPGHLEPLMGEEVLAKTLLVRADMLENTYARMVTEEKGQP